MKNTPAFGIDFGDGLTLLFIGLKLCGVIDWSWLVVLSPFLITLLIGILIYTISD